MANTLKDKTIALAGIFQAAKQVQSIARTGSLEPEMLAISINSIFETDPPTTEATFSGTANLTTGLTQLRDLLGAKKGSEGMEITQYVINLLYLERQLAKQPKMLEQVGTGIEKAKNQAEHFNDIQHPSVIASLAGLYSDTISTLKPRIMVNGEPAQLSNSNNADKIRAILLAGIRSAVLWSQCDGSRIGLLFQRKKYTTEADRILKEEFQ
ncbi:MAG: high frequency lysogenization protein HflD [Gammaproteobacteria bacterium]|nr:high frequency lysogenization protein HflD [Gammaproteobacteria bacterium]